MCIMRNLSYHVHKEVPGAEKYHDPSSLQAPGSTGTHRKKKDDAGCFGGKKAKGPFDIIPVLKTRNQVGGLKIRWSCVGNREEAWD